MVSGLSLLLLAPAALAFADPGAGPAAPVALPRAIDAAPCPRSSSAADVIVCGHRRMRDPYRIPETLRDDGPIAARNESSVAARREMDSLDRFGAQTVGPGGYLQHSRQVDCEWRAARQIAQGRQPDCMVHIGPDEAGDWQRR